MYHESARCARRVYWAVPPLPRGPRRLARYTGEAATAAAAVGLAREVLSVEHVPVKRRRRLTLFEQARRSGEDPSGWVLHRIVSR